MQDKRVMALLSRIKRFETQISKLEKQSRVAQKRGSTKPPKANMKSDAKAT